MFKERIISDTISLTNTQIASHLQLPGSLWVRKKNEKGKKDL